TKSRTSAVAESYSRRPTSSGYRGGQARGSAVHHDVLRADADDDAALLVLVPRVGLAEVLLRHLLDVRLLRVVHELRRPAHLEVGVRVVHGVDEHGGARVELQVPRLAPPLDRREEDVIPVRPTHTTERWGRPSGSSVATVANSGRSSSFLASSGSVVMCCTLWA